ncbi:MAG: HAMP domain-containing sensor histidine kinase [candidate division WOR-3 bacterium]
MEFKSILGKRVFLSIFLIFLILSDIIFSIYLNVIISYYENDYLTDNYKKIRDFKKRYDKEFSDFNSLQEFLLKKQDFFQKDLNSLNLHSYFITDSSLYPFIVSKNFLFRENQIRYFLLPLLKENISMRFFFKDLDIYTSKITNGKNKDFFMILNFRSNNYFLKRILFYFLIYKSVLLILTVISIVSLLKSIERPIERMKDIVKLVGMDLNYDNPDSFVKVFKDSLENLVETQKIEKDANIILRNKIKELEESYSLKKGLLKLSEITSGIAHQLNNNLGSTIGLLQKGIENNDIDLVKTVVEDLKKLSLFTKKFIEFSKDEKPYFVEVDLKEILKNVIERFPLEYVEDFSEERVLINTDPVLFEQVLFNIFDNIDKYSYGKKVELVIKNMIEKIELEIKDSGPGFPDNILEKLYSPFNEDAKGTGLGIPTIIKICTILDIDYIFSNFNNRGKVVLIFKNEKKNSDS